MAHATTRPWAMLEKIGRRRDRERETERETETDKNNPRQSSAETGDAIFRRGQKDLALDFTQGREKIIDTTRDPDGALVMKAVFFLCFPQKFLKERMPEELQGNCESLLFLSFESYHDCQIALLRACLLPMLLAAPSYPHDMRKPREREKGMNFFINVVAMGLYLSVLE